MIRKYDKNLNYVLCLKRCEIKKFVLINCKNYNVPLFIYKYFFHYMLQGNTTDI